ncbi:DinB family protein [Ferruginibacter sp. HRS2-29]|uniref:DinB family protein n=1 Tax=Ferruginibacter sp. HRS2-29 TaxID=2487334 RepID=UPI0020CCFB94|nr:DinB family protein [Ferruginibacter sp. HRS2-29]MCP9750523.1 DinB family protein [Ferruginibacter sp. HRS2-29]
MKETTRIKALFKNLYNGDPWLAITLLGTLENITSEQAAKRAAPGMNSIWEITNHLINWRKTVLQRVHGTVIPSPDHNYFLPVEDNSAKAWQETLKILEETQQQWEDFLQKMEDDDLQNHYPANHYTHYEHIHGIIQHDAYHLGQIALLAKHFT